MHIEWQVKIAKTIPFEWQPAKFASGIGDLRNCVIFQAKVSRNVFTPFKIGVKDRIQ